MYRWTEVMDYYLTQFLREYQVSAVKTRPLGCVFYDGVVENVDYTLFSCGDAIHY